jgi:hypothetical protein
VSHHRELHLCFTRKQLRRQPSFILLEGKLEEVKMTSPADLLRVCDPADYYRSFLERDLLPDGRATDEFRPVSLQLGVISSAHGSAMVRQGGASVVVSVQPEVSVPIDGSGFIVVNVDSSLDAADASSIMQVCRNPSTSSSGHDEK